MLNGKLDADDVSVMFGEKQQIIRKSGLLEYYEATGELQPGGGAGQPQAVVRQAADRVYRPGGDASGCPRRAG